MGSSTGYRNGLNFTLKYFYLILVLITLESDCHSTITLHYRTGYMIVPKHINVNLIIIV